MRQPLPRCLINPVLLPRLWIVDELCSYSPFPLVLPHSQFTDLEEFIFWTCLFLRSSSIISAFCLKEVVHVVSHLYFLLQKLPVSSQLPSPPCKYLCSGTFLQRRISSIMSPLIQTLWQRTDFWIQLLSSLFSRFLLIYSLQTLGLESPLM